MKRLIWGVTTGLVLPVWLVINLSNPINLAEEISLPQNENRLRYDIGISLGLLIWMVIAYLLVATNS